MQQEQMYKPKVLDPAVMNNDLANFITFQFISASFSGAIEKEHILS